MISKISLTDFKSHGSGGEVNIPFESGVTVVLGENGSGKSSIFEAIEFALFGKVKRWGRDFGTAYTVSYEDALIRTGTNKAVIRLNFQSPVTGRHYSVMRSVSVEGEMEAELFDSEHGSTRIMYSPKGVTHEIERLVGLNRDAFTTICYVRQGEISDLTRTTAGERINVINHILNLDIYEKAYKAANTEATAAFNETRDYDTKVVENERHLNEDTSMLERREEEHNNLKPEMKENSRKLKTIEDAKESFDQLEKIESAIEKKKAEINLLREQARLKLSLKLLAILFSPFVLATIFMLLGYLILGLGLLIASYAAIIIAGLLRHYLKLKGRLGANGKKLYKIKAELAMLENNRHKLLASHKSIDAKSSAEFKNLLRRARKAHEDTLKSLSGVKGEIRQLRRGIKGYEDQLKQLKADREKADEKYKDLRVVADEILRGVPQWIRTRLVGLVGIETKKIFLRMFGDKYRDLQVTSEYTVEALSPYGRYYPVSLLSGGEDTAANIALRLGISSALSIASSGIREASSGLGFLIMDEPTTHLDQRRRETLVEVIKAVKNLPQVIIATNIPEIEQAADNIIQLSRERPDSSPTVICIKKP